MARLARVRKRRQARQAKLKKENRYVIKVKVMSMRLNVKQGRGYGSLGSREPRDVPSAKPFHWL